MSAKYNCNNPVVWLGTATFAWSMLFVWQGLDFTDMGFWLTSYQQLYTHPAANFAAACWLSNFIGHWIGVAFGGGVLAYKLGYVMVITMSAIIAYQLLASQLGRSRMLMATVLLTVFFTRGYGGNWIGYNELTALFYLVGAALLFYGLVGNRKMLVALAGLVLGANLFVRLPNLVGISLVTAIWLQAWVSRRPLQEVLAWSAWFIGGFTLGVALIAGLIVSQGQHAIYFQSLQAILGLAVDADSHHSSSGLLTLLISDHFRAFAEALLLLIVGGGIANWASKQKFLLATVIILAGVMLLTYVIYVRGQWRWCVPGFCYIALLSIVCFELKKNAPLALLAFISGMVLFLAPLGSNNGISNAIFGMWLALPLSLTWLWARDDFSFSFKLSRKEFESNGVFLMASNGFRAFAVTVALALLLQSLALAWRHTYLDSKNRLTMTHAVNHPLLAGTFTTAERAKIVSELLNAMPHFAKPGDEVLAYNAIPTLHFLTKTHPWLGDPWPDFANTKKMAAMIQQKEQTGAKLPVIVRAQNSTYINSWPIEAKPVATFWHQDEARRIFTEFEQRHGYYVAWSNGFFEILSSSQ